MGEIKKEAANYKGPSVEEQNAVKEAAIQQVMAEQKFLADLVQITVEEFKKGFAPPKK